MAKKLKWGSKLDGLGERVEVEALVPQAQSGQFVGS